jgi:hypothetical protein
MSRSATLVFALLVAVLAAFVVVRGKPHAAAPARLPSASVAAVQAAAPPVVPEPASTAEPVAEGGGAASAAPLDDAPALASGAPKQVVFGVALVWYRGAQSAPGGARSREEASTLAASIAEEAKKDFAAAVKRADMGFENAGAIQRTVLEPQAEALLFSLGVGEVGGPVDSPRGFYVFRRIE